MRKLRIGYVPISKDLKHPADRRRLVFYAKKDNHEIVLDLTKKIDILVLSEKANKLPFIRQRSKVPIILDLIDSYLTPNNKLEDILRSWFKFMTFDEKSHYLSSKNLFIRLCKAVDAVICSTPEQKSIISNYNFNVYDILDSHSEFPNLNIKPKNLTKNVNVLWEGLPYTLNGLKTIPKNDFNYRIVTDKFYYFYYGRVGKIKTENYINKMLNIDNSKFEVIPWTNLNLVEESKKSHVGILPLDTSKQMNIMKAENRLLIMWRLGLPVIVSETKAYKRVLENVKNIGLISHPSDWYSYVNSFEKLYPELLLQVEMGKKYLDLYHSDEILIQKWREVLSNTI